MPGGAQSSRDTHTHTHTHTHEWMTVNVVSSMMKTHTGGILPSLGGAGKASWSCPLSGVLKDELAGWRSRGQSEQAGRRGYRHGGEKQHGAPRGQEASAGRPEPMDGWKQGVIWSDSHVLKILLAA